MKLVTRPIAGRELPPTVESLMRVAGRIDCYHAIHVLSEAIERMLTIERIEKLEEQKQMNQTVVMDAMGKPVVDPMLTSAEVMAELKIGHDHLNNLKRVKALTWSRIGKGDQFRRSEIDRFIERMKIPSERHRVNRLIAELKARRKAKRTASLRAIR